MCITYIGANMPQAQPMPSVTLQRVQRACTTCFTSRLQLLGENRFSIVVHIDQSLVYMPRSDDHQTITVIVCIWKICGTDATLDI